MSKRFFHSLAVIVSLGTLPVGVFAHTGADDVPDHR